MGISGTAEFDERIGVFLERIWPPAGAPENWISQIGGHPNFPPDWEWPRIEFEEGEFEGEAASLDFLAQINLADLPDVEDRDLLPKEGVLYFFALALTAEPLTEFGPDAWRVLYYPGDASQFPKRPPPPDAGWFLDDTDYCRAPAAELRDPDAPFKDLFPRCPVRAVAAPSWKHPGRSSAESQARAWRGLADGWRGSPPPATDFTYDKDKMPCRVEDALQFLNFARNEWREGVLSFDAFFERDYRFSNIDEAVKERIRKEYDDWLARVKREALDLRAKGRAAALDDAERKRVLALIAENAARMGKLGAKIRFFPESIAPKAMAPLLLDHPEIACSHPDEVAATHPGRLTKAGNEHHRMLGHSYAVQPEDEDDSVLLLQLGSDTAGPRFMWWDMGNLSFTISRSDLAALGFDKAKANIEGY